MHIDIIFQALFMPERIVDKPIDDIVQQVYSSFVAKNDTAKEVQR